MFLEGPRRLDEAGLEQLLSRAERAGPSKVGGLDLKDLHFVDPYGLLGLLSIGSSPAYREGQIWGLTAPGNPAVRSFLKRTGAWNRLESSFLVDRTWEGEHRDGVRGEGEPPLLEVTPVRDPSDVHRAVSRVKGRTDRLLVGRLGYNPLAADRFTVALAEICQNIVDHSESEGFVAAQYYPPARGRGMVRLAVMDVGIGVRRSLASRYASRFEDGWDDRKAVRLAFQRWVSRFDEPGRGLGLKLVAEMVRGWGGRLLLRSGTAAYAIHPGWGSRPRRSGLSPFPGTQINIFLPSAPR
jgi:hypothetical protein